MKTSHYIPHRRLLEKVSDSSTRQYNRRQNQASIIEQMEGQPMDELKTNLAVIAAAINLGFEDEVKLHLKEVMKNDRLVGQLGVARVALAMQHHFVIVSTSDADYKGMQADRKSFEKDSESSLIKILSTVIGEIRRDSLRRKK